MPPLKNNGKNKGKVKTPLALPTSSEKDPLVGYVADELQRLENSLSTNHQAITGFGDDVIQITQDIINLSGTVSNNESTATASILQQAIIRVTAEEALAQLITQLTATVATNESTGAASVLSVQTAFATATSAVAQSVLTLTATVASNNSTQSASLVNEQSARATAVEAVAQTVTTLTATVSTNASNATAQVVAEQTARATAVSAVAQTVTTLNATVVTNAATATAQVVAEQTARATAIGAVAQTVTTLTATVSTNATAATAEVTAERTARVSAEEALALVSTNLAATITTNQNTLTASIAAESSARATATTALAQTITNLAADAGGTDGTTSAAITAEQTARVSADQAAAVIVTNLTATVTTNQNTNVAAIVAEQAARATAVNAVASSVTTLTATVNGVSAAVATEASARAVAVGAALASAAGAQSTADGKIDTFYQIAAPTSASVGDLWFDTDDGNTLYRYDGSTWIVATDQDLGIAINAAAGAQATADGKVATFYQATPPTAEGDGDLWVDTDDGNKLYRWSGTAWTIVQDTAIPALQLKYGVSLNANGYITGFSQNNDGSTGKFRIIADDFRIIDPSATIGEEGTQVFSVINGVVSIAGDLIVGGSITTGKIADNAVTNVASVNIVGLANETVTSTTPVTLLSLTFTGSGATAEILANVGADGSGKNYLQMWFYLNGSLVNTRNYTSGGLEVFQTTTQVGVNTLVMKGRKSSNTSGNAVITEAYMRVLELKK
tara:strand:+ start:1579 stop:3786 length:2208 start_codon:yes stop_codon:yes gene_type:complete